MGPREYSKEELDNHSNQMNSNHDAYWQARGYDERPEYWEDDEDDLWGRNNNEDYDRDRSFTDDDDGFYWSGDY